jgi:hypothetical protein
MKKKMGCFLVFVCCCSFSNAQQLVPSGGYAVQSDVSVNWLLGGSLSGFPTDNLGSLTKLQSEQLMESEIALKIYPMPANDFINIEITPVDTGRLILELYNNSGVKILNKLVVNQPIMQVNISEMPAGVYYLRVIQPGSANKLFTVEKIIKK